MNHPNIPSLPDARIAIVGLGYVGLPLAVEFGKQYDTIGFDIDATRIDALRAGRDSTLEVETELLAAATRLRFSARLDDIRACNVYIVTVPTPIDAAKRPDLTPLVGACEAIGSVLKAGDVVVFESTVYPGSEEVCVPILEAASGLRFASGAGADARNTFTCGYSPECIHPGDKAHRVTSILKVTSGSTPEAADFVDALYKSVIAAGTHKASSIKVAEAAKVIENTQRDLNIALVNDLAILFNKLGIDTLEVLEAAGTKWNFLPFRPGLVGGHCISVDPYYLCPKAQEVGHHPDVILAGHRTNDGMGTYIANEVIRLMVRKHINPVQARVLVLGLAFKENCPDLRNTRIVDILQALQGYDACIDVYDPWVDPARPARIRHHPDRRSGAGRLRCGHRRRRPRPVSQPRRRRYSRLRQAGLRAVRRQSCTTSNMYCRVMPWTGAFEPTAAAFHSKTLCSTYFTKDSRINIRLSSKDLRALQKRAMAEGMPYQTLVASVLHKFVEGQMVEQPADCSLRTR